MYDFLKPIFEDSAVTFDEFIERASAMEIELTQGAEMQSVKAVNAELKSELDLTKTLLVDFLITSEIEKLNPINTRAIYGLIDKSVIEFDYRTKTVTGLSQQLENIKNNYMELFVSRKPAQIFSGATPGKTVFGGRDLNSKTNSAIRKFFNR